MLREAAAERRAGIFAGEDEQIVKGGDNAAGEAAIDALIEGVEDVGAGECSAQQGQQQGAGSGRLAKLFGAIVVKERIFRVGGGEAV